MNTKLIARIVLAFIIGCLLIFVLSLVQKCYRTTTPKSQTVRVVHHTTTRTFVHHDTVTIQSKPKIVYREKIKIAHDTIHFKGATVTITDTLQGDTITARASQITLSDTTREITNTDTVYIEKPIRPKPKRFSVNLGAGYGYSIGSPTPQPQIGITVGLKLFSF